MMNKRRVLSLALALSASAIPCAVSAQDEGPLANLQMRLDAASLRAPGHIGIAVEDLATGLSTGINTNASMPAASTIKIPVMVEVFKQMADGTIDLNTTLHLTGSDIDDGWGDLADAPIGTKRSVKQLLLLMITESDNTATNMLIRLIGRQHVNDEMAHLGLHNTHLDNYIRSNSEAIRYGLLSSPKDMMKLLDAIARDRLVDQWSSREMLTILSEQHHNGLLPQPLPPGTTIAHKTGSLHDTLDDVGIVYRANEPYVIAVMTTNLPTLDDGRSFIHSISRIAYDEIGRVGMWRAASGIAAFDTHGASSDPLDSISPDQAMWSAGSGNGSSADPSDPNADPTGSTPDYNAPIAPPQTMATAPASERAGRRRYA